MLNQIGNLKKNIFYINGLLAFAANVGQETENSPILHCGVQ